MSYLRSTLFSSVHKTFHGGKNRQLQPLHHYKCRRIGLRRIETSSSSSSSSSSSPKFPPTTPSNGVKSNIEAANNSNIDFGLGLHFWRLACAFGFVYVTTEYGVEFTICEGPSMLPTINSYGEIIMIDRLSPKLFGLQGGPIGVERVRLAREKQRKHERVMLSTAKKNNKVLSKQNITWHEPMIPSNELPASGRWNRLFSNMRTGVSVGDVVVVQHPDRVGTVCKRVLGLPGDVVTKPRMRDRKQKQRLRRRRTGMVKVPDGHIWVEGDNPWNSSDSRNYGPVPSSLIVGRVLLRVWPLGKPLIERGARPERPEAEQPRMSFSGSVVLPAGYENQVILRRYTQLGRSTG